MGTIAAPGKLIFLNSTIQALFSLRGAPCVSSGERFIKLNVPTTKKMYTYRGGRKSMQTHSATLFQEAAPYQIEQSLQILLHFLRHKCLQLYHHSLSVQSIAHSLAQSLSLSEAEISTIKLAALCHDVGKIMLPDDILQKAGKLTHQEFETMKHHSRSGAQLLQRMKMPRKMIPLVYHHHERWDGTGYPDGIAGNTIPLGARIIALSDAFDVMTSHRPYQPPRTSAQALTELERCAGTQFDPFLTNHFCTMHLTELLHSF
jgi:putative nucleotidyltransferase with HDIG domain